MLGLTIATLLLALPFNIAAQGSERAARCEVRGGAEVVDWDTEREALNENAVRIELSESYRKQVEAYRKGIAALSSMGSTTWAGDDDCPHCDTLRPNVPDEFPVVSIHMERNTKTSEGHGFLDLQWDQRETADVDLFQINPNLYFVVGVSGSSSLKAPLGNWYVEHEDVPDFYPPCLYPGRALIQGNVRDGLQ